MGGDNGEIEKNLLDLSLLLPKKGEMIWDITATVDQLGMTWRRSILKATYTCALVL
jgi:hypothetical protein